MNKFLIAGALIAGAVTAPLVSADVGVSISIGQPGYYGHIELGDAGRPRTIYSRPVIIQRGPRNQVVEPLYLRVPRAQASNWRRYCGRYDACGRPVYFVSDDWYNRVYVPHYRASHRDDRRDDRRDDWRDDRRDDRDDRRNDRRDDHRDH